MVSSIIIGILMAGAPSFSSLVRGGGGHELACLGDQAVDLGLRASYRLDRLSTRFVREPESDAPPSSYVLSDDDTGTDVWAQARTGGFWANYAHADHAYGPWQPLADGARFDVTFDRPPAPARAANEPAAKALAAAPAAGAVPAR